MVSPKWQIAGYHENTMISVWLTVHPRGRTGTMDYSKTHVFRHFLDGSGCCWMEEKEQMVPGDGVEPPTLRFSVACSTN